MGFMKLRWHLMVFGFIFFQTANTFIYVRNAFLNATIDEMNDAASTFGPDLVDTGFVGFYVFAEPEDACSSIKPPSSNGSKSKLYSISGQPRIVVIRRGNCSFYEKVLQAQIANYSVVIVYNNDGNNIIHMSAVDVNSSIVIPSVFISESNGLTLKSFSPGKGYYLYMVPSSKFPVLYYIVPFFVIICPGLIAITLGLLCKYIIDMKRKRRNLLSRSNLRKLPEKKICKGDEQYDTCAICLEDYVIGERIRILPCNHAFHSKKCIDPWLLRNRRNCPICKYRIIFPGDNITLSDEEDNQAQRFTSSTVNNGEESDQTSLLTNTTGVLPTSVQTTPADEEDTEQHSMMNYVFRLNWRNAAHNLFTIFRRRPQQEYDTLIESSSHNYGTNENTFFSNSAYEPEVETANNRDESRKQAHCGEAGSSSDVVCGSDEVFIPRNITI